MIKILLVEDDETQAKVAKIFLEEKSYKVIIAEDVKQSLKVLKKTIPDLILLDIIMPGDYGDELLKKLMTDKKWKSIPVIIVTVVSPKSGIKEDIKKINPKAGFLEKPYSKKQLLKIITDILKN